MPIDLTTISGTLYNVLGQPKQGITVWIVSAVKSGLAIYDQQIEAAVSDANGAVSFTVPRASTVWLYGSFFVGATDFDVSTGISLVIPDSATATLESLGAAYSVPVQGLTIKSNGTALTNLCGTVDFSSDFTVTESPTGEANIGLSASLIVTTEQVQDALTTFFPDSGPYDWTYDDDQNKVGLVIAPATSSVNGLMAAADKTLFDAIPATYAPIAHTHIDLQSALDLKAALDSPALTGIPTGPTAAQGTNTTQLSTTAFVRAEIAALVGTVPSTLDTLDELAQALGDDPNFATTMTTALGLKANTSDVALLTAANVFTVNNAAALAIGPNGNTNPVVRIVTNVASQADGISITGNAAGAGTTIAALSSGSNSGFTFTPKGTGRTVFNGNVGIGGTPNTKMDIHDAVSVAAFPATSGSTQSTGHRFRLGRTDGAVLDFGSAGASGLWLQSTNGVNLATNYPLILNPNGGNIGIGTIAPLSKLSINGGLHVGGDSDAGDNNLLVDGNGTISGNVAGASIRGSAVVFGGLPASPVEGMLVGVTDSSTATWGATITGGGANHVLAYYNGTNWKVACA